MQTILIKILKHCLTLHIHIINPRNTIPSADARNERTVPVKRWEHQDATILIKTMKYFFTLHIHITNLTSLTL